jgi:hypothetical protein
MPPQDTCPRTPSVSTTAPATVLAALPTTRSAASRLTLPTSAPARPPVVS